MPVQEIRPTNTKTRRYRLVRVHGATDNLHSLRLAQQSRQSLQCEGFVVDKVNAKQGLCRHRVTGTATCTVVPASSLRSPPAPSHRGRTATAAWLFRYFRP